MTDFTPGTTAKGKPCKTCVRLGERCKDHPEDGDEIQQPQYARENVWVGPYLEALRQGFTKTAAAGIAGIHRSTPAKLRDRDPDFAEREDIAYDQGGSELERIAYERIKDKERPADSVLKHLLACRGVNPPQKHEHSGPDGGPLESVNRVELVVVDAPDTEG